MRGKYLGWIVFGIFMVLMIVCAVSFAYFTVGQGDNTIYAAVSALGIFASLYFGMVKTPGWFIDNMNW